MKQPHEEGGGPREDHGGGRNRAEAFSSTPKRGGRHTKQAHDRHAFSGGWRLAGCEPGMGEGEEGEGSWQQEGEGGSACILPHAPVLPAT